MFGPLTDADVMRELRRLGPAYAAALARLRQGLPEPEPWRPGMLVKRRIRKFQGVLPPPRAAQGLAALRRVRDDAEALLAEEVLEPRRVSLLRSDFLRFLISEEAMPLGAWLADHRAVRAVTALERLVTTGRELVDQVERDRPPSRRDISDFTTMLHEFFREASMV